MLCMWVLTCCFPLFSKFAWQNTKYWLVSHDAQELYFIADNFPAFHLPKTGKFFLSPLPLVEVTSANTVGVWVQASNSQKKCLSRWSPFSTLTWAEGEGNTVLLVVYYPASPSLLGCQSWAFSSNVLNWIANVSQSIAQKAGQPAPTSKYLVQEAKQAEKAMSLAGEAVGKILLVSNTWITNLWVCSLLGTQVYKAWACLEAWTNGLQPLSLSVGLDRRSGGEERRLARLSKASMPILGSPRPPCIVSCFEFPI